MKKPFLGVVKELMPLYLFDNDAQFTLVSYQLSLP